MYVPAHAREDRAGVLHEAIAGIGFGTLITVAGGHAVITHLPMKLIAGGTLGTITGHVSRANTQWHDATGSEAAMTFVGASFYVSPSSYATKTETGKVVPTWDYIAVEARGTIEFFDDRDRLFTLVSDLTDHFEASRSEPWNVTDAPSGYIENQLRAIVGFTVPLASLTGAWKLSFNRSEDDRAGVAALAERSDDPAVRDIAPAIRNGTARIPSP